MQDTFTILCCLWRRLSPRFYKTFAMVIFLSLTCFTVYFSVELLVGYLKTFSSEIGGQIGKCTYAMREGSLHAYLCVRWGQGVKFLSFW